MAKSPALTYETLALADLEYCRRQCRAGNPFPLIALQWPELLITNPAEAKYFKGAIDDPDNPCLRLDDWQRDDIIAPFFDDAVTEIAIKGNTKAGKGACVSMSANLWFDIWPESKIILASQQYKHAVDVIFGEIVKWRKKMRFPGPGDILAASIADTPQHYIRIANPQSGEGFSGQHGDRGLFIFDEASSIPEFAFDDAYKQARKLVALANPRVLFGGFRDMYSPCADRDLTQVVNGTLGLRKCVTISGSICCNVRNKRLDRPVAPIGGIEIAGRRFETNERIPADLFALVKPLIPDQVDYGRYMAICSHKDPRHVDVFAHGKFPEEDEEKQVILASWLHFHREHWRPDLPISCFSLDPAASLDGDDTILAAGGKEGVAALHDFQEPSTMKTVQWVLNTIWTKHGINLTKRQLPIVVDMDGIGKGVGDRLAELGVWVIEYHGNASSGVDSGRYANLRTESYGELGRRLDPRDRWGHEPFGLPPDSMLAEELCAPEKVYQNDALRFIIAPKRRRPGLDKKVVTIADKIGRSPDRGDAVVMLFYGIRELGLWTSMIANLERQQAAYPMTDKDYDKARQSALESLKHKDTDKSVRDLIQHLQQQASGIHRHF